jgi:hypothetical protein
MSPEHAKDPVVSARSGKSLTIGAKSPVGED